jgi:hypothetical protein
MVPSMKASYSNLLLFAILSAACSSGGPGSGASQAPPGGSHQQDPIQLQRVEQSEAIVLSGDQELVIENQHFVLNNDITLNDQSRLIVRSAIFEHRHSYSFQYRLQAFQGAKVVIENAEVRSSEFMHWVFSDTSQLKMNQVTGREFLYHS